ncbi:hypothetical protein ACX801_18070 [Arthrobacter bambusae]
MNPSTYKECSTPAERDALLRDLVAGWQREYRDGPCTRELFGDFLPSLLAGLRYEFPSLDPDDPVFHATKALCEIPIPEDVAACAWMLQVVRNELRTLAVTRRHWLSERDVKDGVWAEVKKNKTLGEGASLVSVCGDESDWPRPDSVLAVSPSPLVPSPLWDELRALVVRAGWDPAIAQAGLDKIREKAANHALRIDGRTEVASPISLLEMTRALGEEAEGDEEALVVPKGHRKALVDFVCGHQGYLWARLHGISPEGALARPGVREALESLVWNKARPRKVRTRTYSSLKMNSRKDIPA